jgi:PAS domain S-box-containing protein
MKKMKKEDDEAKKSAMMLQRIINLLPTRIFWKDKNGVFLGCNTILAMDGGKKTPDEIIGKTDFEMSWNKQADDYRKDDLHVINTGNAKLNFEEPQTTPNGNTIWLKTSKMPLTDFDGKIIGILGIYDDITEKKKAEEEIIKKTNELERFNKMVVDRELKMIELKKKIAELEEKLAKSK